MGQLLLELCSMCRISNAFANLNTETSSVLGGSTELDLCHFIWVDHWLCAPVVVSTQVSQREFIQSELFYLRITQWNVVQPVPTDHLSYCCLFQGEQ